MKLTKTPSNKRETYTYTFAEGRSVTLTPGKDGVTEALIKCLHAYDDSEVHYNLKATSYTVENESYDPADPASRKTNRIWFSSLDDEGRDGEIDSDKSSALFEATKADGADAIGDMLLRDQIADIARHLTKNQQTILRLMYEGYRQTEIAHALGVSGVAITKQKESIKRVFAEFFFN